MNESDSRPADASAGAPDTNEPGRTVQSPTVSPAQSGGAQSDAAPSGAAQHDAAQLGGAQSGEQARTASQPQAASPKPQPASQPTQPIPGYGQSAPAEPQAAPQYGQRTPQYGQQAPHQGPSPQPGQPGYGQPQYGHQAQPQPPQYGQPQYGQHASQGQPPYGAPQYGQQAPQQGSSFFRPETQNNGAQRTGQKGRWGTGVLIGGMLVAGLVGGGVVAGTSGLWAPRVSSASTQAQNPSPVIVNNQDSVNAVTAAAAKASPSVVTIGVTSGSSAGTGSGVVLDDQGHILTNTHVVTLDGQVANPTIEVRANNGAVYKGTVVGTDPLSDLAVVKVDGANLTPITFGDSGKINVGDAAIAIGAPLGLENTVTDGIVSTLNRTISVASSAAPQGGDSSQGNGGGQGFQFAPPGQGNTQRQTAQSTVSLNVLQTDAPINPGNSGGALVNSQGQLIGINVAIASTGQSSSSSSSSGNIGVGFSIPATYAHRIADEIIATGKATHGQLGVSVQDYSANGSGSSFSTGAQVASVTSGSAADKAGIKQGDVVTQFAGLTITDASELTAAVHQQAPGSTVKATIQRNGQSKDVDVTVGTAQ
ncbi:trypsin-like peptidase domain-containing protein [Sinomonas sp. ASV486]|uniref:S1C family serine protease n=1 Tax=Sinomonas sp. ASV486 TaxID=3051170 RepID=UPI0027DE7F3E|nr:trypsin-like peptidase domain-containing protein [Sinomonas sp. ASV486]MDQ4491026.1 trypsin-like peptidase domain-containing protein [Sinomonas sp. ASV486]